MFDFDLNLLTHLAVLVETGSVTESARRLGISQPAMSRSLARLRALLGDPILVRTRGGMLPTRRAEELAVPLRSWLAEAGRMVAPPLIEPGTLVRRFRVIASDYGLRSVMARALPSIRTAAPGAGIDVLPPGANDQARLASGEADLLLTGIEPDRRLVHERLVLSEHYLCVARAGHPLLPGGACGIGDLLSWPHVGVRCGERASDPLTQTLLAHGLERNLVATFPYQAAAGDLLAASDALMLLPRGAAQEAARDQRLAAFPAPAGFAPFRQWLAWHNRSHRDPAVEWLIGQIAAAAPPAAPAGTHRLQLAAE